MYNEECKFKVGDKVRYINDKKAGSRFYPKVGTIGIVREDNETSPWVQWEVGSTIDDDYWAANEEDLELVEE